MSVATQISRIQKDRNTIRTKLVELGMAQNTDDLDKLAAAISGIVDQGAVSATVMGCSARKLKTASRWRSRTTG